MLGVEFVLVADSRLALMLLLVHQLLQLLVVQDPFMLVLADVATLHLELLLHPFVLLGTL